MNRPTIALLLGFLVVSIGCKKPPPPAAPVTTGPPAAAKPMPAQIPPVLARVNGEPINKWEFDDAVRRIEAMAGSPVPPDRRDEVLRGALDQLVAYHLIAQEARARKMGPTDADVEARLAKLKGSFPDDDAFQKGIAAQGLTVEVLRAQAKLSLEVARFLEAEVSSKIAVTDSEIDAFYKQNLDRFKQAEAVHARHRLEPSGLVPGESVPPGSPRKHADTKKDPRVS